MSFFKTLKKMMKTKTTKSKTMRKTGRKTVRKTSVPLVVTMDYDAIKGFRQKTYEKNFNALLLKLYRKGAKTLIITDDEYADKKYNIKNQVKKRGLVGRGSFVNITRASNE